MHLKGWGMPRDVAQALQLFEISSKAGNLLASHSLAMLHLAGHTRERRPCEAAVRLLKRIAVRAVPTLQA